MSQVLKLLNRFSANSFKLLRELPIFRSGVKKLICLKKSFLENFILFLKFELKFICC